MDFNTGRGGERPDDESRPLFSGETGRPVGDPGRGPAGGPGGEFNLQDPINSFINTVRNVVLNPAEFFRGIRRRQGDFVNPLVFALICALVSGILGGISNFLLSLAFAGDPDSEVGGAFGGLVGSIIVVPITTAIGLFIGAGILHLLVLLLVRPGNAGYEATFRVVSYSNVTQLVSWIPIIGFIASLYGLVLVILGIREVHDTTTGRAALVVLIPVAVVLLLILLLATLIGAALFLGSQQQF